MRHARAGRNSIALTAALRSLHLLKPGHLTLTVTATDVAGRHMTAQTLRLTLLH